MSLTRAAFLDVEAASHTGARVCRGETAKYRMKEKLHLKVVDIFSPWIPDVGAVPGDGGTAGRGGENAADTES